MGPWQAHDIGGTVDISTFRIATDLDLGAGSPPWNYHALPAALGRKGWFTAKVTTLGELDAAPARASTGETASYNEVVGGKMDFPASLALAHQRLDAMYANS